ncbi:MAG: hypothetical protein AB1758_19305 [Candidatus Eremiobacterota bacterium]
MTITTTTTRPAFNGAPARASAPATPADTYQAAEEKPNRSGLVKVAGYTLVGAGLGVYAGLSAGPLAMLAGAAAGVLGGTAVGALAGGFLAEKVLKVNDESKVAGLVIGGGLVGLAAGVVGGIYVGASAASPVAAVAMGLLGGVGGFFQGALRAP